MPPVGFELRAFGAQRPLLYHSTLPLYQDRTEENGRNIHEATS